MKLYIKRLDGNEVVEEVEVAPSSEHNLDKFIAGLTMKTDSSRFWIDSREVDDYIRERNAAASFEREIEAILPSTFKVKIVHDLPAQQRLVSVSDGRAWATWRVPDEALVGTDAKLLAEATLDGLKRTLAAT